MNESAAEDGMISHPGGCHCGRVRFTVAAPARLPVHECNCSICAKAGYLHLIVPRDRFHLERGEDAVVDYTFNTATAHHWFCGTCGIKSFYVPRSHPDGISVNARCLDGDTVTGMDITPIDGRHWEQQYPAGRADDFPS